LIFLIVIYYARNGVSEAILIRDVIKLEVWIDKTVTKTILKMLIVTSMVVSF